MCQKEKKRSRPTVYDKNLSIVIHYLNVHVYISCIYMRIVIGID